MTNHRNQESPDEPLPPEDNTEPELGSQPLSPDTTTVPGIKNN
jgi:hypothetical protein